MTDHTDLIAQYGDDYARHVRGCRSFHNNHSYFAGRTDALADQARHDAEVWEQGRRAGGSVAMRRTSDEPSAPDAVNPYHAAAVRAEAAPVPDHAVDNAARPDDPNDQAGPERPACPRGDCVLGLDHDGRCTSGR